MREVVRKFPFLKRNSFEGREIQSAASSDPDLFPFLKRNSFEGRPAESVACALDPGWSCRAGSAKPRIPLDMLSLAQKLENASPGARRMCR